MSNIDYTLWPNANGTLGQIKVQIPDGITTTWPEGDVLVGNFVFNKGNLVGFVDTKALIANESKSTTFPYDYVNVKFDSIKEGDMTFVAGERTKRLIISYGSEETEQVFKYKGCKTVDDVKAVDPNYLTNDIIDGVWTESLADLEDAQTDYWGGMFSNCYNLTHFSSNLDSLKSGYFMFSSCANLATFDVDNLDSLTNGGCMFHECAKFTSFPYDLPSLTNGSWMFVRCSNLLSFSSDLSSLMDGYHMFYSCPNLTIFNTNLSSLENGECMFSDCIQLNSFTSDLSKLTYAYEMFWGCKLDTASVQNIADTINTPSSKGTIHIGIINTTPNSQETTAFNTIASKNWTVFVGVNGGSSTQWTPTSLIPIDGEEQQTPIPYWAKPVPSDEQHARYIDSEGNFYNILGGNYIYGDNLETYGMFTSLEDAQAQMRLKKIDEEEIQTA